MEKIKRLFKRGQKYGPVRGPPTRTGRDGRQPRGTTGPSEYMEDRQEGIRNKAITVSTAKIKPQNLKSNPETVDEIDMSDISDLAEVHAIAADDGSAFTDMEESPVGPKKVPHGSSQRVESEIVQEQNMTDIKNGVSPQPLLKKRKNTTVLDHVDMIEHRLKMFQKNEGTTPPIRR